MSGRSLPPGGRAGAGGVLAVVALLVLVVTVVLVGRSFFAGSVMDHVRAEQLGSLALTLAESAVDEMSATVASQVNDRNSELYRLFRDRAVREEVGWRLPLSVQPTKVRELIAREESTWKCGLTLESARAWASQDLPVADLPSECAGTVTYEVCISARTRPPLVRIVRARQEFKMALLSMPRPFDQVLMAVRTPEAILGGEATSTAARFVDAEMVEKLRTLVPLLAKYSPERLAQARSRLDALPRFRPDRTGKNILHPLRFPMLAFCLPGGKYGDTVRGEEVELASRLRRLMEGITEKNKRVVDLLAEGEKAGAAGVLVELVDAVVQHQQAIHNFEDRFEEYTGTSREKLDSFFNHLDRAAVRRKAFFRVTSEPTKALRNLLEKMGRFSGVVWVENPGEQLDLSNMTVRGKLVIGVLGDVRLRDTRPEGEHDLLTVISYGTMVLAGRNQASLAALGRVAVEGTCTVQGNLVLSNPAPGCLTGLTVSYDSRILSGRAQAGQKVEPNPAYYFVGLSPRLGMKEVLRQRP